MKSAQARGELAMMITKNSRFYKQSELVQDIHVPSSFTEYQPPPNLSSTKPECSCSMPYWNSSKMGTRSVTADIDCWDDQTEVIGLVETNQDGFNGVEIAHLAAHKILGSDCMAFGRDQHVDAASLSLMILPNPVQAIPHLKATARRSTQQKCAFRKASEDRLMI